MENTKWPQKGVPGEFGTIASTSTPLEQLEDHLSLTDSCIQLQSFAPYPPFYSPVGLPTACTHFSLTVLYNNHIVTIVKSKVN